jgi:signal recognition particle receptor subunit beta
VKILNNKQLSGAPVLIFANKQDLDKSLSGQEIAKLLAFKSDLHSKRSFHIEQGCALNA